jgi:hypothetical protein
MSGIRKYHRVLRNRKMEISYDDARIVRRAIGGDRLEPHEWKILGRLMRDIETKLDEVVWVK